MDAIDSVVKDVQELTNSTDANGDIVILTTASKLRSAIETHIGKQPPVAQPVA